jgi:hypothetical protein
MDFPSQPTSSRLHLVDINKSYPHLVYVMFCVILCLMERNSCTHFLMLHVQGVVKLNPRSTASRQYAFGFFPPRQVTRNSHINTPSIIHRERTHDTMADVKDPDESIYEDEELEDDEFDPENDITPADTWECVSQYFEDFGHIKHQKNSYDYFIEHTIPHMISTTAPIVVSTRNSKSSHKFETHRITYKEIHMSKPRVNEDDSSKKVAMPVRRKENDIEGFGRPNHARVRSLTYSSQMFIDIEDQITKAVRNYCVFQ